MTQSPDESPDLLQEDLNKSTVPIISSLSQLKCAIRNFALLAKAAVEDLEVDNVDIDTAFLNPTIKQEIFMKIPKFFALLESKIAEHEHDYYLKPPKSLHELKQAPRELFLAVKSSLEDLGQISSSDPNLLCL
ncbi:hypothetical protein K3495_g7553 [Podosphaera aphanis]|nr:hypothetical protein K3495_g7553 [Podosphaera aphanis]